MSIAARGPCDEAILAAAEPKPCPPTAVRWVLAVTVLGSSMAFIDMTVVNVALPVLQRELDTSVSSAQWIIEAYALFLASLVLVGGSLADRFGRRRVFTLGATVFALASAACGAAPEVHVLIAARALQGVGAALLVPSSLAILGASFPQNTRGRAVGTWSALTSVAGAIGPVAGGWLVEVASWRAVFYVNLPIAAAVVAIALRKIPETRSSRFERLDVLGALLATVGLGGIVFGLVEAPEVGWSDPRVAISLTAGLLALTAFVVLEARSRHPMVSLDLFRIRVFAGSNLLTFFLYAGMSALMFLLPFHLIQAEGYTPTQAGAALLPLIVLISALSRSAGVLADRIGPRIPLAVGPAIAASGFFLLAVPQQNARYVSALLPALAVVGLGMAVTVAPLTATVLNAVSGEDTGTASGINNAVARVAGLLAIAALGVVVSRVFDQALDRRLAETGLGHLSAKIPPAERHKLGAAQPPAGTSGSDREGVKLAIVAALRESFRASMKIAGTLGLLASASAIVLIRNPRRRPQGAGKKGRHT